MDESDHEVAQAILDEYVVDDLGAVASFDEWHDSKQAGGMRSAVCTAEGAAATRQQTREAAR